MTDEERAQMLKITHHMLIELANDAEEAGAYQDVRTLERCLTIVSRQLDPNG